MTAARESLQPKSYDSKKSNLPSHLNNNNPQRDREARELLQSNRSKKKSRLCHQISFSKNNKLLINLKVLKLVQKSSSSIAFLLVTTTLYFYVCSFCLPQLWSKQYKKLETLQRHERQLTIINESLKKQLAQQAENPDAGLENFDPTTAIFMPPAKASANKNQSQNTQTEFSKLLDRLPLGY
jgi:hypothetical protein